MRRLVLVSCLAACAQPPVQPEALRAGAGVVDLHMHLWMRKEALDRAVEVMDASGVGVGINLSGGSSIRPKNGAPSPLERSIRTTDRLHPGRFVHYMNVAWPKPADMPGYDWQNELARQVEQAHAQGAAGLKISKRLGLYLRDQDQQLIPVDSPKLDALWRRCGELGMPVSIHVADPKAFWEPYNDKNERWTELKDHKSWWFGDPKRYPPREEILAARNRVIARHPGTTFVCVHFGNNPEDVDAVDRWLDTWPNMMIDLAARVPEIGRHDPEKLRRFFVKHRKRILFATDFMSLGRFILGSGGDDERPSMAEAKGFYATHWRFMETDDRGFAHMTPIQGEWTIDAIGLDAGTLYDVYRGNALRLLGSKLPAQPFVARRVGEDFELRGDHPAWEGAGKVCLERQSVDGRLVDFGRTEVALLWSEKYFYLRFDCPCTELSTFAGEPEGGERMGLWEKDVVEAFIAPDPREPRHYSEYELAPDGEKLDLRLQLPEKDFGWSSGFDTAVEHAAGHWVGMMRIPMAAIGTRPKAGDMWRLNLYRCDRANRLFLAASPTLTGTFHRPWRFGRLRLLEATAARPRRP